MTERLPERLFPSRWQRLQSVALDPRQPPALERLRVRPVHNSDRCGEIVADAGAVVLPRQFRGGAFGRPRRWVVIARI